MEIKDKDDDSSTSSDDDGDYDLLPNNVQTKDQIAALPMQYVSGDPNVPLQSVDRLGNVYKYALNPTTYSVRLNGFPFMESTIRKHCSLLVLTINDGA